MSFAQEEELLHKSVKWAINSAAAIQKAGGNIKLLNDMPKDLISTFVRNGLELICIEP